jgi:2-dehydro-3-deoxygluconokinase
MTAIGAVGEGLAELSLAGDGRDVQLGFGGDAANVCVMAARLGAPARLAGRVGDDALGARLLAFWERRGVDVSAVQRDVAASTGLCLNDGTTHRFTYWRRGSAGSRFTADDLRPEFFDRLGILVVTGVTLAVSESSARAAGRAVELARAAGARIACVLNRCPALGGDPVELARLARASDIVIASTEDATAVFGAAEATDVAAALDGGPDELVLTDGPRPAVVRTADGTTRQPVPRMRIHDATGAGDALAGAYLAARLRDQPPEVSLRWGVAAASLSVGASAAEYPSLKATAAMVARLRDTEVRALRTSSTVIANAAERN